jgi:hypothetical protein
MGFVRLRDEAAAAIEQDGKLIGNLRKRADGQMTDEVRDGLAGDGDLAGDVELHGGRCRLLSKEQGAGAEQHRWQPTDPVYSGKDHGITSCSSSSILLRLQNQFCSGGFKRRDAPEKNPGIRRFVPNRDLLACGFQNWTGPVRPFPA